MIRKLQIKFVAMCMILVTAVLGVLASVFLAGNILLPMSPGALSGLEYALAAALAVLGWVLYQFRDRSVGAAEQEKLIFGDLLAEELPPTPCKISKK